MNAQVKPMAVEGKAWLVEVAHQEWISGGSTHESHAFLPPATHSACLPHGDRTKLS